MPIFIISSSLTQRGAASLENAVSLLIFLLLALAAYESAHWLLLRQTLNTVLLDTARVAATQQAHPQIINDAFIFHLQKLPAFSLNSAPENWRIEKISAATSSQHDYQALQYQQGHTQVFEDNTLHLRLHYMHRPITPIVRSLLWATQGRITIITDIKVAMQSDQTIWKATQRPPFIPPGGAQPPISTSPLPFWEPDITAPASPSYPWQPPTEDSFPVESCDSDLCCGPL